MLWSSARIRPTTEAPVHVNLPFLDYYNGTRRPIVLQHVLISPLGYTLDRYTTDPVASAATYRNTMAAILGCEIRITAPGRKHLSRRVVLAGGHRPRATGLPSPDAPWSSLMGVSAWEFDFRGEGMVLPRSNQIQFDLSGYTMPNVGLATLADTTTVRGHITLVQEQDTHWKRMARWSGALPIQPKVPLAGQPTDQKYPVTPNPVYDDGFGFAAQSVNALQPNATFDGLGSYDRNLWQRQEANMSSDEDRFTGFSIMLDQIELDAYMQTGASTVVGDVLAPLAQRVGLRARTLAGGTGEQWFFHPGAPVSLCCPTINEVAVVHDFDDPISLDPNAGLKIEIVSPGGFQGDDVVFPGIYNIGVSVVGYAIVE